ncbi:cyclic pyranopterin monophosphate synthase MoaC [Bacillota bacterium Meth-B3]
MEGLTHLNERGEAFMVDVAGKAITARRALARGRIHMSKATYEALSQGGAPKGDVLGAARVAGIMAVKRTSELIPLCHALPISKASIEFEFLKGALEARCEVSCQGPTGVEMEALTGVSVALLTVYDMLKALEKDMVIGEICLLEKTGGKSGPFRRTEA